MPNIANITINKNSTTNKLPIDFIDENNESTTNFNPSFLLITLNGLSALNALNAFSAFRLPLCYVDDI